MKRIVASVGLVALGAASVHAQSAINGPAAKPWNVSATLRGFYDDNFTTVRKNPISTYGYEISPSAGINVGNDQTTFSAKYTYSFIYYDHRRPQPSGTGLALPDKYDQDHNFSAQLFHAFNERYNISVRDSFVVGQEPDTLRAGSAYSAPFRVSGDNIVNSGAIAFNAQLTPLLGLEVGYNNGWYHYANDKIATDAFGNIIAASNSGLLDRIEHAANIEGQWNAMPETKLILGYRFGEVDYTGDQATWGNVIFGPVQMSDVRDNCFYIIYVGADHNFLPNLSGSVRAGASYYDYFNDPANTTSFGPYALASLTYTYAPESYLQVGFQEQRSATDLNNTTSSAYIHDAETSVVYGTLYHRILPSLYGSVKGTFQNSIFNGGGPAYDNKTEQFYTLGLDLEYKFNHYFSAHTGYDYDRLTSDVTNRGYDRNRVYIGVTASY